ncbi:polysaccharide pyruvyl transferase family protein [Microbacterium esteraromaticum]|uniref:Polysaccharide pyruvyl transferase family protein n=1 Tax=Microbacterium esteraromaticum TaxID=57043 RepID=A0A7D8ALF2_9MICO|nr:polysaccharide pyruvyl transferase family protein [Microbacterium esteraromaticum]QMU97387.1 polysaccharide pyruvyl transferase family protein [Microbacterium esteraromaticum]
MRVLVLWAAPRHANFGVAALAEGAQALVHQAVGDADVRFHGTGIDGDGPMNIGHLPPLVKEVFVRNKGLRDWLRGFDLLIDMRGGDSFTDIYGLKRLYKMSFVPLYARRLGVPVVLGPQTIGPFKSQAGRRLAQYVLRSASQVHSRDPVSAHAAQQLGRPVDGISTDVAFAIAPPVSGPSRDVMFNVSGLLWSENPHVDNTTYRASVCKSIDGLLANGREVTALAHVVGANEAPGDNDRFALAELEQLYGDRLTYLTPTDLQDVRSQISGARLMIGARMHACLNAMSVGVPAVPMAYSRKFKPLLDQIGWEQTIDLSASPEHVADQVLRSSEAELGQGVAAVRERAGRLLTSTARDIAQLLR